MCLGDDEEDTIEIEATGIIIMIIIIMACLSLSRRKRCG
jgi:hypothetical protein